MRGVTIKALAEDLAISKVALNNRIKSEGWQERLLRDGNKFLIPSDLENELRRIYADRAPRPREAPLHQAPQNEDVIALLREELQAKDEQIHNLTSLLDKMTDDNAQLHKMIREQNAITYKLIGGNTETAEAEAEPEQIIRAEKKSRVNFIRWLHR